MAFLDETGLAELWSIIGEEYGIYKKHWWRVVDTQSTSTTELVTSQTAISADVDVTFYTSDESGVSETARTIQYATSISIDEEAAEITLVNPQEITVSVSLEMTDSVLTNLTSLAPIYITNLYGDPTGVYYLPSGSDFATNMGGGDSTTTVVGALHIILNSSALVPAQLVTAEMVTETTTTVATHYVQSAVRNAYPDSGTEGTLTYAYLGIPFDNAVSAPKIATGSYTGTGTYGKSLAYANSLTFDFEPKFVLVQKSGAGLSAYRAFLIGGATSASTGTSSATVLTVEWDGNTVYWYLGKNSSGVAYQLNESGTTYEYFAIG